MFMGNLKDGRNPAPWRYFSMAGLQEEAYLGDAEGCDVLAVRGGAVSSPPQASQDAADALHGYASVDGVVGRRRGAGQARAGVVIADGLHGGR